MSANPLSFLIKIANDQHQTQQPTVTNANPESTQPEPANTNRAKKLGSRSLTRKKQPQRGMGVAQLERLRIQQESWKTGAPEANQLHFADVQPVSDTVCGVPVPVQYGAWNVNGGVPVVNIGGLLGRDQGGQLIVKRADDGLEYYDGVIGSGHQILVNRSTDVGPPSMRGVQAESLVNSAAVYETSRELTSTPKISHHYEPSICDVCLKKKRFYGESMRHNEQKDTYVEIGYKGTGDNYTEISSISTNGFRFPGLNQQNSVDSNGEMGGCNARHIRSSNHSFPEGDEVVAIYRRGKSGGNVFMEYEFFPGKNGISTPSKEMECPSEASVAVAGEASWAMTSDDSGYSASNAPKSVDLSLKLSY